MTTWLPWNPTTEATREEYEALVGRRVRMTIPGRFWATFDIVGVTLIDGEAQAIGPALHLRAQLWPMPDGFDQLVEFRAP